jgi:hypothetical protein
MHGFEWECWRVTSSSTPNYVKVVGEAEVIEVYNKVLTREPTTPS